MHEMSIATAIWDLASRHLPANAVLRSVRVQAGPMRAIEPRSMEWAWDALMWDIGAEHVALELTTLPWDMQCTACGRQWKAAELSHRCICGSDRIRPIGGDELRLVSIEVDDAQWEQDHFRESCGATDEN
jgi:hydrogenase nickel incorporation protein HypA/HybF